MVGSLRRGWTDHHHREQVVPRGKRTVMLAPKARSCTPSDTALLDCGPQRGAWPGHPWPSQHLQNSPRALYGCPLPPGSQLQPLASGLHPSSNTLRRVNEPLFVSILFN